MKLLPKKTFDTAAKIYVVANTPMYLYKHLRNDPTVTALAEQFDASELLGMISSYTRGPRAKKVEAPVAAYACLVALSFKPTSEFKEAIMAMEAPCLRWLPEIRDYMLAEGATSTVVIDVPPVRLFTSFQAKPATQIVTGVQTPVIRKG